MKKKIAFRSGSLRMGGLERILIEVLKEIDKSKYDITLFIEDDCGEENIFEGDIPSEVNYKFLKDKKLRELTEKVKSKKKNLFYKVWYNYLMVYEKKVAVKKLKEYLIEDPEIKVIIDFDAGLSKAADQFPDIKKVAWIHNSIPKLKKKKDKIERFGKRLGNYQKVVAICNDMKDELLEIYPHLKGKVDRIYNPFNFERIETLALDDSLLNENEKTLIEDDYVIAVSRLDNVQKDYKTLVDAYKIAKEKGFKSKLYIVGDGPDKEDINGWIKDAGLEKYIVLLGLQKNPYIWMKNSKFFVHSSKYEGLPTVLIEAMICGKTVVSSDCPTGPREILDNGRCGELIPVGDSLKFSEGLLKMQETYSAYEAKVKERAMEFHKKEVLKQVEELIDNI